MEFFYPLQQVVRRGILQNKPFRTSFTKVAFGFWKALSDLLMVAPGWKKLTRR